MPTLCIYRSKDNIIKRALYLPIMRFILYENVLQLFTIQWTYLVKKKKKLKL